MGIFMDLIKCRYSCRKYDSRPVEREKIQVCIEAASLGILQPYAIGNWREKSVLQHSSMKE